VNDYGKALNMGFNCTCNYHPIITDPCQSKSTALRANEFIVIRKFINHQDNIETIIKLTFLSFGFFKFIYLLILFIYLIFFFLHWLIRCWNIISDCIWGYMEEKNKFYFPFFHNKVAVQNEVGYTSVGV